MWRRKSYTNNICSPIISPNVSPIVNPLHWLGTTISYILDLIPTPAVAYSLRKLKSKSTLAIRVRRSNDNAEMDIGFSGLSLDTTTLLAFVGANSGYVTTWYDQSGNNAHAIQSYGGAQPIIVTSGVYLGYLTMGTVNIIGMGVPFATNEANAHSWRMCTQNKLAEADYVGNLVQINGTGSARYFTVTDNLGRISFRPSSFQDIYPGAGAMKTTGNSLFVVKSAGANQNTQKAYLNSVDLGTGPNLVTNAFSVTSISVGFSNADPLNVYEFMAYNSEIDGATRVKIENYDRTTYNLVF